MNELYAINPECLKFSAKEIKIILQQFGMNQGRFIANYPNNWKIIVKNNFQEGTLEYKAVSDLIFRKYVTALLPAVSGYSMDKNWDWEESILVIQSKFRRFEEIFGKNDHDSIKKIELLLGDIDFELKDGREDFLTQSPEAYAKVCEPLFQLSEEVVLHDYLFTLINEENLKLDNTRIPVLKSLIKAMIFHNRVRKFLIIFNKKKFGRIENDIKYALYDICKECDPKGEIKYICEFLPMSIDGASEHPRCIFSIKGGLQFDQGFQITKTNPKNLIRWMSNSTLLPFQSNYLRYFHPK